MPTASSFAIIDHHHHTIIAAGTVYREDFLLTFPPQCLKTSISRATPSLPFDGDEFSLSPIHGDAGTYVPTPRETF
jgi:hypothetical protein